MLTEKEFLEYYDAYNSRLVRTMRNVTRCMDVEDVCQDAWKRAWEFRDSYRQDARFFTWLWSIAKNAWLSERRRPRVEVGVPDSELAELVVDQDTPERLAYHGQLLRLAMQYPVLELRYVWDLNVIETAALLQSNSNTIKTRTTRALARLRVQL